MKLSLRAPGVVMAIAAVVCLGMGILLWFTAPSEAVSFGWFSYEPLPEDVVLPRGSGYGAQRVLAASLVAAGLVLSGLVMGFRLGRRVGTDDTQKGDWST